MNDRLLNQYCLDWVKWCKSRCFFNNGKREDSGHEPGTTGLPPDARLNPDMQFFNMAIHALADMREHRDGMACFSLFYVEQDICIKREADRLGIARSTYYRRIIAFARRAYSMAQSIKRVHIESIGSVASERDNLDRDRPLHFGPK